MDLRKIILAGVTMVFGAACSMLPGNPEPPPAVQLGAAPETPTGPRYPGAPLHPSGFYQFDQWPKACDLLTDADLRTIFPQVTDTRRASENRTLEFLPVLVPGAVRPPDTPDQVQVIDAGCTVALAIPGIDFDPAAEIYMSRAQVMVEVRAAGSAEIVQLNSPKPATDAQEITVGAARCYSKGGANELSCSTPHVAFDVWTEIDYNIQDDEQNIIRYQRGTETTAWPRDGGPGGVSRRWEWERSVILPELVKAIAAKL
ncbi:hypothetical protein ABZV91_08710 [Nocardia sp. NPDC004568]|uniref:hypothetical protein n=1 Tax=Nocardia sp. NPDC004568 TaxID=3154551 RepID=UPI0033BC9F42